MSEIKTEPQNLMDGLIDEMNRVREVIKEYELYPAGAMAAAMMKHDIKQAEQAIKENDVIKMMAAYKNLKDCQL